jgi:hypothetical protein
MVHLLYKHLVINKQAALPGVGLFSIVRKPATLDVANKVILPPVLDIHFDPQKSVGDRSFSAFLVKENGMDEATAIKHLEEFAQRVRNDMHSREPVELPGIGILRKNANEEIDFEPANVLADYFPLALAEPVVREKAHYGILVGETERTSSQMREALQDEPETVPVGKDYWWIYAIILAIIGIAAILYYYQQNGSLR